MALKRLLILGGTGFIGRHLCLNARDAGYAVTSLSLKPGAGGTPGIRYVYGDVTDPVSLSSALGSGQFEYVINSSGYIDHRHFNNGGRALIRGHFDGVQNLVEKLDRNCLVRFVQLGSSDEYGNLPAPQNENMRECPIAPYSLAKLATTHFLQMLWRTEAFPALTIRLFLTFGPGQDSKRFLPQVITGCLENKTFPVSAGTQLRDFCHVGDVSRGILDALAADNVCGEVINLGSGVAISIREVIERVQKLIGRGNPEFGRHACRREPGAICGYRKGATPACMGAGPRT
jgi:nucleoside-diphosphate-sugar epimerase